MKTRGILYWLARLMGDASAVKSGSGTRMAKRAKNKVLGRTLGKFLR